MAQAVPRINNKDFFFFLSFQSMVREEDMSLYPRRIILCSSACSLNTFILQEVYLSCLGREGLVMVHILFILQCLNHDTAV